MPGQAEGQDRAAAASELLTGTTVAELLAAATVRAEETTADANQAAAELRQILSIVTGQLEALAALLNVATPVEVQRRVDAAVAEQVRHMHEVLEDALRAAEAGVYARFADLADELLGTDGQQEPLSALAARLRRRMDEIDAAQRAGARRPVTDTPVPGGEL
jgi:hypothetical protein